MAEADDRARYERLDAAVRAGDMVALRAEIGALPGFPDVVADPAIGRCLTYAIYHGPITLVRALLDAGADPKGHDGDGFPPLIAALTTAVSRPGAPARPDAHDIVTLLLARGADVAERGVNDYTPLHVAASNGDLAAVDILLSAGADPNEITRIDDFETPLEVATHGGHKAVADRLRPLTVRPTWEHASKSGDVATLTRMVREGHDINALDGHGQTALMRAAHAGRHDAVEWLIGHGANLNHASKFHLTALMLAVVAGHPQIARMLVTAGADAAITATGAPGFHGRTAADLAEAGGDTRLAAFIRKHGTPSGRQA